MKRSVKFTVLTVALTLMASTMFAVTTVSTTNNNNVTATVQGSCQWTTPLTMAFGTYDPFAASALTLTTSVKFNCVKKTNPTDNYRIWFSKTAGAMLDTPGPDSLNYTLTDGLGVALPTNSATSTAVVGTPGLGLGTGYTFTVKGSVAAGQNVEVGNYVDTVMANVDY